MTEIHGSKDCGNSPKNKFVQDVAIALETADITPAHFSDDVTWESSAQEPVKGRDELARALSGRPVPASITVDHAISHGKVGAASGEVTFGNGEKRRFSHVIEFTNARANCVAVIRSYA